MNHLAELFTRLGLRFTPQAGTEASNKPDFIFPGEREYHDATFNAALLVILGVKSTSKDRWRQVLHPDSYEDAESGWPRALKRFAAEAWRRADTGELADEELYCCDAPWSGLYDRMHSHEPDEMERRLALAADYREGVNG